MGGGRRRLTTDRQAPGTSVPVLPDSLTRHLHSPATQQHPDHPRAEDAQVNTRIPMPRPDAHDADEVLGLLGNAAHEELELEQRSQHHARPRPPPAFHHADHLGITQHAAAGPYYESSVTSSPRDSPAPSPAAAAAAHHHHHQPPPPISALRSASNSPAPGASPSPALGPDGKPGLPRRQSSFAQPRPDGTPRTPNRVRFDEEAELIPLEEASSYRSSESARPSGDGGGGIPNGGIANGPRQHPYATRMPLSGDSDDDEDGGDASWADEEDFLSNGAAGGRGRRGRRTGRRGGREQRLPLLTDIEAPSVTVANSEVGFSPEDLLESARPKSGLRSAFMNMANSIMYVLGSLPHPHSWKNSRRRAVIPWCRNLAGIRAIGLALADR